MAAVTPGPFEYRVWAVARYRGSACGMSASQMETLTPPRSREMVTRAMPVVARFVLIQSPTSGDGFDLEWYLPRIQLLVASCVLQLRHTCRSPSDVSSRFVLFVLSDRLPRPPREPLAARLMPAWASRARS